MSVQVHFFLGIDADPASAEPLLVRTIPVVPRVGEGVVLPVKHEANYQEYIVRKVRHFAYEQYRVDVYVDY